MKYIVTSGPMESAIDSVRRIQNSSSGKLGATFIEELNKQGISDFVYIHTIGAEVPNCDCKRILIENHQQLLEALATELTDHSVVVHAMAISDFEVAGTITQNELASLIINNKQHLNCQQDVINLLTQQTKIVDKLSSRDNQLIVMNKSVKVIDQIKQLNPKCKLIGFKLLANTSVDELLAVGTRIKQRADCDYVVANLKEQVGTDSHHAYIIGTEVVYEVETKTQIAQKIIELMEE